MGEIQNMFKDCKCRIFIKKHNKTYPITSMHWDGDKLTSIKYIDLTNGTFAKDYTVTDDDVLMTFTGQFDKNKKEIWLGSIVKFDPREHSNYILGVVTYDVRTTSFVIEQLTQARDFYQTQKELDEEFEEHQKQFPNSKPSGNIYQFDSPTNWYNIAFYDHSGSNFSYSELEVIGTLYEDPVLVTQHQEHQDYVRR